MCMYAKYYNLVSNNKKNVQFLKNRCLYETLYIYIYIYRHTQIHILNLKRVKKIFHLCMKMSLVLWKHLNVCPLHLNANEIFTKHNSFVDLMNFY